MDAVERVAFAGAAAQGLLLEPASALVHGGGAELDDVECVEDRERRLRGVAPRIDSRRSGTDAQDAA